MKVRDLLNLVQKLSLILDNYQDYRVDEMLDDIYRQTSSSIDIQENKPTHEVMESKLLLTEDIINQLREMEYEGRINYLSSHKYTKSELKGIVDYLQIKVKANSKKAELIEVIANYDFLNDLSYKDEKVLKVEKVVNKVEADDLMAEAVVKIPEMNQDEIIAYLEPFRKYEILEIARRLNVKIAKSNTRDNVILLIGKHFGYKDINRRILERPRRER